MPFLEGKGRSFLVLGAHVDLTLQTDRGGSRWYCPLRQTPVHCSKTTGTIPRFTFPGHTIVHSQIGELARQTAPLNLGE